MITAVLVNPTSGLVKFSGVAKLQVPGQVPQVWTISKVGDSGGPYTLPGSSSPMNVQINVETGAYYFYALVPPGRSAWFVVYDGQFLDGVVVVV